MYMQRFTGVPENKYIHRKYRKREIEIDGKYFSEGVK